jgi:hypothetical protein
VDDQNVIPAGLGVIHGLEEHRSLADVISVR